MTLTEVAVASAILVIAVVPMLRALTVAQMTGRAIERKTQSLILAQNKLDEIRARCVHHYANSFDESSAALAGAYLCNVTDDEDPKLRQMSVAVGYDGNADGRLSDSEVQVRLTTYIARTR
jgi:Tfp pilus assembly protein PilV